MGSRRWAIRVGSRRWAIARGIATLGDTPGIATLGDTRMTAPPRIRPRGLTPTMIKGTSMARPIGMARRTTTQNPMHTAIRRGRTLTGGTTLTGRLRLSDHWASSRRSSMRPSRRQEPSSAAAERAPSGVEFDDGGRTRRRLSSAKNEKAYPAIPVSNVRVACVTSASRISASPTRNASMPALARRRQSA